jgi:hypothetical protein
LTGLYVGSFAAAGTNLFAGTYGDGVFLSTNSGTSWAPVDSGLADPRVQALAVAGNNLLAGTLYQSVWRRPLSEMITAVPPPSMVTPRQFALDQNYPNPFNPTTAISYQLSAVSKVELVVYDMLGREVATLVHEVKQPGTYSVHFDGSHLASGAYFYRLQARSGDGGRAGSFTETRKLVLLK